MTTVSLGMTEREHIDMWRAEHPFLAGARDKMVAVLNQKVSQDFIDLFLQEFDVTEEKHEFVTEVGLNLICGPRMEHYGPPQDNLNYIGAAITPYVKRALAVKGALDGTDVSAIMIILKVIRSARGFHHDSFADICGYAALAEVLNDRTAYKAFVERAAQSIEDPTERQAFINKLLWRGTEYIGPEETT